MFHSRSKASTRAWVGPAARIWGLQRNASLGTVLLTGLLFLVAQTATQSLFLQRTPMPTAVESVGHQSFNLQRTSGVRHFSAAPRRNGRESRSPRTVMHAGDELVTVLAIGAAGSGKSETC